MKGKAALVLGSLALAFGSATAAPISLMIGDADGFGGSFATLDIPQDHRSAAEAAATNGAQQTDFYSTLFTPLSQTFTVVFSLPQEINSLNFDYRSFGLQASVFGGFGLTANGIDVSSLLNFEDGAFGDATHSGAFSAAVLSSINSLDSLTLVFSRQGSGDAVAFDYFRVSGDASQSVPEPTTLALVGMGVIGACLSRRRKQV